MIDISFQFSTTFLIIFFTAVLLFIGFTAYRHIKRSRRRAAYPRNVVILHQFGRGNNAPSMSPFALKLETWFES